MTVYIPFANDYRTARRVLSKIPISMILRIVTKSAIFFSFCWTIAILVALFLCLAVSEASKPVPVPAPWHKRLKPAHGPYREDVSYRRIQINESSHLS